MLVGSACLAANLARLHRAVQGYKGANKSRVHITFRITKQPAQGKTER